jgi:hypothetical protein
VEVGGLVWGFNYMFVVYYNTFCLLCFLDIVYLRDGTWHRDAYSLFDDESLDLKLPTFYLTVLIPLVDVLPGDSTTEFIVGSHKLNLKANGLQTKEQLEVWAEQKRAEGKVYGTTFVHIRLSNFRTFSAVFMSVLFSYLAFVRSPLLLLLLSPSSSLLILLILSL